jgi:hypothetical protein
MGAYPGRVMTGISDALTEHGKLSYSQLCYMLYGPKSTDADRASMARAIRQLAARDEVVSYFETGAFDVDGQHVETGMWVRRPDVAYAESRRFFELPTKEPSRAGMSRAELLRQDPSYGTRHQDCMSCGMPYSECFVQHDLHVHGAPGHPSPCACTPRFGFWGDGTPTPVHWWDGEPDRCCWHCFHHEIERASAAVLVQWPSPDEPFA